VPPEMLKKAQDYLPDMEVYLYDAGHAFANDARPSAYVKDAASLAHQRSEAFLKNITGETQ
jgi:carboxymethylenebutenolidase